MITGAVEFSIGLVAVIAAFIISGAFRYKEAGFVVGLIGLGMVLHGFALCAEWVLLWMSST